MALILKEKYIHITSWEFSKTIRITTFSSPFVNAQVHVSLKHFFSGTYDKLISFWVNQG